ncbi:hypothetical protein [Streptomyces griseosporeus]|uniref:hypothetical protein n=1 Tax=Streptomyces griseosporeus TaxID=1910 RepID=UPI0036FBBC69
MLLAATLLLCSVPFLLNTSALAGRSAVSGLSLRLGLNGQAAADVRDLFTSDAATSAAVTGLSWVFFILSGIAATSLVITLGAATGMMWQERHMSSRAALRKMRRPPWPPAVTV